MSRRVSSTVGLQVSSVQAMVGHTAGGGWSSLCVQVMQLYCSTRHEQQAPKCVMNEAA